MKQIDILDLEYSSRGRDIDIVEPTLSYLELKYGLKIRRGWLFHNSFLDLIRIRPKLLVIANGVGSFEHFATVKFAHYLGVKVVTFVSEGDFLESQEFMSSFFWGWNKDYVTYENMNLQWSQRNIDMIQKKIPISQRKDTKIRLVGATGFDKYKLLQFMTKEAFLNKYSLERYSKIVGIAGWGFDHFFGDYYDRFKNELAYSQTDLKIFRESLYKLREGYEFIIKSNPYILFVLKYHPVTIDEKYTEFYGLEKYSNVIVLRTEENIYDVINISDIWIAFESTTCLEAWLMGKTTLLYNPIKDDFKRSIIANGSYIVKDSKDLSNLICTFFEKSILDEFENLKSQRIRIIEQVIGFNDGRSFIRAANNIKSLLDDTKLKCSVNIWKLLFFTPFLLKKSLRNILHKYKFLHNIPGLKNRIAKSKEFRKGLYSDIERMENANIYTIALKERNVI